MSADVIGPLQIAMRTWRAGLGMEVTDCLAKARAGISASNWSKIENGHPGNYRDTTYAAIDRAFDWPHGTAKGLSDGSITAIPTLPMPADRDDKIAALEARIEAKLAVLDAKLTQLLNRLSPPTR